MKKLLILPFLFLAFTVMAQLPKKHKSPKQDPDDTEVFNITKNIELLSVGMMYYTQLEYKTLKELVSDLDKRKEKEFWTEEEYNKHLASMPLGGMLIITTKRISHNESNNELLNVIIKDKDNKEVIYRDKGKFGTGRLVHETASKPTHFVNVAAIPIQENVGKEFYVYITDRMQPDHRFEYLVKVQ